MTKIEYGKCEKLMEEAIRKAKQANEEYKELNIIHADDIRSKLLTRKADQHHGYAEGIHQSLAVLCFKHEKMKELSELL